MLNEIKADISDLSPDLEMSSYGLYQPQYDFSDSLGYKDRLQEIRDQQKNLIKNKAACIFNNHWQVNGSIAQGRKMNRNNIKAILRSFNNEMYRCISTKYHIQILIDQKQGSFAHSINTIKSAKLLKSAHG